MKKIIQNRLKNRYHLILYICTVSMPLLCVLCLLFIYGNSMKFNILIPTWNDEVGWFTQVEAMIKEGKPLGYLGYNGTHAKIGHWGPWGVAPLFPYAIWGSIFSWKFHYMTLANISFLCFSILIFILIVKPEKKQLLILIIMYFSSRITVGYSLTSMSEGSRYSLAIILIAILIWTERNSKKLLYNEKFTIKEKLFIILSIVFIFYALNVYLIFALVIPVLVFFLLRKYILGIRIFFSVIITILVSAFVYNIVAQYSAPYPVSTISNLIDAFSKNGLYYGVTYSFNIFLDNISTLELFNIVNLGSKYHGILMWFFITYVFILIALIISLIKKNTKSEDFVYEVMASYFMIGFLFGYCILYTGSPWTLCRGINTGLIMVFMLLCLFKKSRIRQYIYIITVVSMISGFGYFRDLIQERENSAALSARIHLERKKLESIIDISSKNNAWANTIAHYGTVNNMYLSLPVGIGMNYMINEELNKYAKYALISKCDGKEKYEITRQMLENNKHSVIYEDEFFIVLIKKNFNDKKFYLKKIKRK